MASATGTGRRAGLDRDEVVDAAVALVEAGGADALSMRKLAAELGVATTTIYWHAGNRDELILAVVARVAEQTEPAEVTGDDLAERIVALAEQLWAASLAHRNVAALAHQAGATALLGHRYEEAMARELAEAGITGDAARDVVRAVMMVLAGFLVVGMRRPDAAAAAGRPEALWLEDDADLPPETLTALARPPDLPALFRATLRGVVEGLGADR